MDFLSIPFILCLFNKLLLICYFIYYSIYYKHRYRANAEERELIPRIVTYRIMVEEYRTLSKIHEHAEFTEQIQKFTANGKSCCKIEERRAYHTAHKVELPSGLSRQICKIDERDRG